MTRKKFQNMQRILALNPTKKPTFQDKKKYGVDSEDGKPMRGDPGNILAMLKAKNFAKKMKAKADKKAKEKGAVAKSRWGKVKLLRRFGVMGSDGSGDGEKDGEEEEEEEEDKKKVVDTRPMVNGVRLDHPNRVAAFVEAQKKAGRTRKEALEGLRKLTPNAVATQKMTAFFTAADALVARAGIMAEIPSGVEDEQRRKDVMEELPEELANMSMAEEAVVERALVSIARWVLIFSVVGGCVCFCLVMKV